MWALRAFWCLSRRSQRRGDSADADGDAFYLAKEARSGELTNQNESESDPLSDHGTRLQAPVGRTTMHENDRGLLRWKGGPVLCDKLRTDWRSQGGRLFCGGFNPANKTDPRRV
jgi:hypothetical protein